MAPKRAAKQYDVVLAMCDRDTAWVEIAAHLETKGFCTIDPGLSPDFIRKALDDADACDSVGRFHQPAELLADGLLGSEGSARIMELERLDADSREVANLMKLDSVLSEMAALVGELLPAVGLSCPSRTPAVVHETGMPASQAPTLGEEEASNWLGAFSKGRIMLLLCLGPVRGTLELRPFDEEAEEHEISTFPGSIIVLRSDAMYHKHFAHSKALVMTCFLMEVKPTSRGQSVHQTLLLPPPAKALEKWVIQRMKQLKEEETATGSKLNIPDSWLSAMNHMFHTAQRVAVRGIAGRYATTWNATDFWKMQTAGVDLMTEVPLSRWDMTLYYDPNPEAWRVQKVYLKHGSFMDGAELFDCRFFGLSPMEASGMDPHQRTVLEVGYEALRNAGYKKGKLMNSVGGVYLGATASIFGSVAQSTGATGGAASITSNRFSFCLGLKGPSMTIDTEGSSSLSAVYLGAEAVLDKGRGVVNQFSLAGGVSIQLGTLYWPQLQAAGLLSPQGRCFAWDTCADGYAMGDGVGFVCQKKITEFVDGQQVYIEGEPLVGAIVGSVMNSNGMNAAMNAPNGPAEQEMVTEALRNGGLAPFNIDCVECHGQGAFMADAIEVDSLMRVLRPEGTENPLCLTAVKSRMGHAVECSGVAALHRTLLTHLWATVTPNNHLNEINPYVEPESHGLFMTESLEFSMHASYCGVTARGFGGTNVHVITYGQLDPSRLPPPPAVSFEQIQYWPAGGGELEESMMPVRGFFITGTFTRWRPVRMEDEGDGSYGYTVVLGENRWEDFQILLDGDAARVLHPGRPQALAGAAVCGPDAEGEGLHWRINAQSQWEGAWEEEGDDTYALAAQPEGTRQLALRDPASVPRAKQGDKFRVSLRIAGKYRAVLWERLLEEPSEPEKALPSDYYVAGDWSDWSFEPMASEGSRWVAEVVLPRREAEFQIVRNEDWGQTICPGRPRSDSSEPGYGPGDGAEAEGFTWCIEGSPGDVFRITFEREFAEGGDWLRVSWDKVQGQALK